MLVFPLLLSSRESITRLCPVDACPVSCFAMCFPFGVSTHAADRNTNCGDREKKDVQYGIRRLRAEMQRMFRHLV